MTSVLILSLLAASTAAPVDDCTGMVPLIDMGPGQTYQGQPGGLYPGGVKYLGGPHLAEGMHRAVRIRPLDANGNPDPNGKIVLLSIGMSNTSQEFGEFIRSLDAYPDKNPAVVVVNGAQGGQDARQIANPNAPFWSVVDDRLAQAGVTRAQVQAVWHKEAVARPTLPFPDHAIELRELHEAAMNILASRFPNLKIVYSSSRIYAGYAETDLNPEPYAYESAFSVRWLIRDQINGDPGLNYDPRRGPVTSPWIQWGPYLWADGVCGRSDGLQWFRQDFAQDGTHPSASGRRKVAAMLLQHFTSAPTARIWFLRPGLGVLLGDMNGNGQIDGGDANAYLLYEADPKEFARRYPNVDPIESGDITEDGVTDNRDLLEFMHILIRFTSL
ncbi:MAG: hypothetical protein KatS3mg015_0429 [Fimbriimonadales bacterium]|nr:MAG: hypothetical protein KatS3mg015_0429 [Fimbriimonadales bacterium]